ncbi:MAG TPA: MBL fold metallo-hydrolase [Candidatus Acidoferrales bacterium]|jgi:cyclase|nr:MBL fold metallo-hydrolase [Candidatus Acidoferrales bacterium]
MKRFSRWFALAITAVLVAVAVPSLASGHGSDDANAVVHILPVQGNIYMLVGAGANITAQVGNTGVLLVDTGLATMSDKVLAAVRTLSDKPIRYIVDTTDDPDHVGGNESIAKTGSTITGGNVVGDIGASAGDTAAIISFQTILDRMSAPTGKQSAMPQGAWPTDAYETPQKSFWFNGDSIRVFHQPGHTDGDSIVYFRRADVVSAGEIFRTDSYPVIDLARGGSIQGILDGLNHLLDLTVPADEKSKDEGGTLVIPGHGRLCDQADVVVYQEMVTIVRDRVQDMVNRGLTLEQVKADRPTRDYDPLYGTSTGQWTTDMFVEAVYRSLSAKQ